MTCLTRLDHDPSFESENIITKIKLRKFGRKSKHKFDDTIIGWHENLCKGLIGLQHIIIHGLLIIY